MMLAGRRRREKSGLTGACHLRYLSTKAGEGGQVNCWRSTDGDIDARIDGGNGGCQHKGQDLGKKLHHGVEENNACWKKIEL